MQIVLGFVYMSLSTSACITLAGCFIWVKSSHDEVRAAAAAILVDAGAQVSRSVFQGGEGWAGATGMGCPCGLDPLSLVVGDRKSVV